VAILPNHPLAPRPEATSARILVQRVAGRARLGRTRTGGRLSVRGRQPRGYIAASYTSLWRRSRGEITLTEIWRGVGAVPCVRGSGRKAEWSNRFPGDRAGHKNIQCLGRGLCADLSAVSGRAVLSVPMTGSILVPTVVQIVMTPILLCGSSWCFTPTATLSTAVIAGHRSA
jgi:hypothetical protein